MSGLWDWSAGSVSSGSVIHTSDLTSNDLPVIRPALWVPACQPVSELMAKACLAPLGAVSPAVLRNMLGWVFADRSSFPSTCCSTFLSSSFLPHAVFLMSAWGGASVFPGTERALWWERRVLKEMHQPTCTFPQKTPASLPSEPSGASWRRSRLCWPPVVELLCTPAWRTAAVFWVLVGELQAS